MACFSLEISMPLDSPGTTLMPSASHLNSRSSRGSRKSSEIEARGRGAASGTTSAPSAPQLGTSSWMTSGATAGGFLTSWCGDVASGLASSSISSTSLSRSTWGGSCAVVSSSTTRFPRNSKGSGGGSTGRAGSGTALGNGDRAMGGPVGWGRSSASRSLGIWVSPRNSSFVHGVSSFILKRSCSSAARFNSASSFLMTSHLA
mmetsp:Transcript_29628/g.61111  ORF Transcript_29628/g.61111 Transcript_29628/m.61111 type:complete len:203 (-) Transcript_29628:148-756(-)